MQKSLFKVIEKNSRVIEISTPFNVIEYKNNENIIKLECGNEVLSINNYYKLDLGKWVCKYKIRSIISNQKGRYTLISYKRNHTTQYILPCLNITKEKLFFNSFFINAYLDLDSKFSLNGKFIYLVYRYIRGDEFRQVENFIKTYPNYYKTIDISSNLVSYAFEIPNQYWNDIDLFLKGDYSKISNNLKIKIAHMNGLDSVANNVVTKNPSYIKSIENYLDVIIPPEMELEKKPNISDEILIDYD